MFLNNSSGCPSPKFIFISHTATGAVGFIMAAAFATGEWNRTSRDRIKRNFRHVQIFPRPPSFLPAIPAKCMVESVHVKLVRRLWFSKRESL